MPSRTAREISPALLKKYRPDRTDSGAVPTSDPADEGRAVANSIAKELKSRFGASRVMLFGSFARGDFHRQSDIDLSVWGIPSAAYYRAVAFASGFSEKFKVDLVDVTMLLSSCQRRTLHCICSYMLPTSTLTAL